MTRNILITGASSGIGKALALHYAGPGVRLGLLGRDAGRLAETSAACRERGSDVVSGALDVRRRQDMDIWIGAFDRGGPVDLVFASAGVLEGRPAAGILEPSDAAYELMEVNILGVANTVHPLVSRMIERRRGHIVLLSSIAGFVSLPDAPSYSASKAAVIKYGLSLRASLACHGVDVSVVCPGYVETPMTGRQVGAKPSTISAEHAARLIDRGVRRNKALIVFPFLFGTATRLSGLLPDRLRRWAAAPFRFSVSPRE